MKCSLRNDSTSAKSKVKIIGKADRAVFPHDFPGNGRWQRSAHPWKKQAVRCTQDDVEAKYRPVFEHLPAARRSFLTSLALGFYSILT